jgi:hypothetical protein
MLLAHIKSETGQLFIKSVTHIFLPFPPFSSSVRGLVCSSYPFYSYSSLSFHFHLRFAAYILHNSFYVCKSTPSPLIFPDLLNDSRYFVQMVKVCYTQDHRGNVSLHFDSYIEINPLNNRVFQNAKRNNRSLL